MGTAKEKTDNFLDSFSSLMLGVDDTINKANKAIDVTGKTAIDAVDTYNKGKDTYEKVKSGTSSDMSPSRYEQNITNDNSSVSWWKRFLSWFFGE